MKSEAMAYFYATDLSLAAFMIFLSFFLVMLFWVYHRSHKPMYQHLANLPLGDD